MASRVQLSETQIRQAIADGEFGDDVIRSHRNVAVVMSQSWCPQWLMMRVWLATISAEADLMIYVTVYDHEAYFHDFMRFKESVFKNYEIPYVRYYQNGVCIKESNYTSKDFFLKSFGLR